MAIAFTDVDKCKSCFSLFQNVSSLIHLICFILAIFLGHVSGVTPRSKQQFLKTPEPIVSVEMLLNVYVKR
jgi:hypothetical protein